MPLLRRPWSGIGDCVALSIISSLQKLQRSSQQSPLDQQSIRIFPTMHPPNLLGASSPITRHTTLGLVCLLASHTMTAAAAPGLRRDHLISQPHPVVDRRQDSTLFVTDTETWAIRSLSRVCSTEDTLCEWTFIIDTGAPLPGDPGPAATFTTHTTTNVAATAAVNDAEINDSSSISSISKLASMIHKRLLPAQAGPIHDKMPYTPSDTSSSSTASASSEPTLSTTLTTCTHPVPSMTDGTPASRATSTAVTKCGVFGVTSGWTRVSSDGSSTSGLEATAAEHSAGAALVPATDGFTVLSVVDYERGVLVYPAYSDVEILTALADGGGGQGEVGAGVVADRRYTVEKIP
ncbi:hypothetical protein MN608_09891 [Microdochium nivale]|nr:hypothetical protein MN608_09891 [Microdochium nivale]